MSEGRFKFVARVVTPEIDYVAGGIVFHKLWGVLLKVYGGTAVYDKIVGDTSKEVDSEYVTENQFVIVSLLELRGILDNYGEVMGLSLDNGTLVCSNNEIFEDCPYGGFLLDELNSFYHDIGTDDVRAGATRYLLDNGVELHGNAWGTSGKVSVAGCVKDTDGVIVAYKLVSGSDGFAFIYRGCKPSLFPAGSSDIVSTQDMCILLASNAIGMTGTDVSGADIEVNTNDYSVGVKNAYCLEEIPLFGKDGALNECLNGTYFGSNADKYVGKRAVALTLAKQYLASLKEKKA